MKTVEVLGIIENYLIFFVCFFMNKNFRGIWFYGLAGSGKTFASHIIQEKNKNSFLIDGDEIRKHVSFDLGYTFQDRLVQLERLIGLARITLNNNFFPVCSSVLMTYKTLIECKNEKIEVVKIERSYEELKKVRSIYEIEKNVVGNDLRQETINTPSIYNDGTKNFKSLVVHYVFKKHT